jgi:hypothetical protein
LNRRSLLAFVTGLLALAASPSPHAWGFENHLISSPVVRDNLAVYFVHGNGTGTAAPMPLDQALASGAVKINESPQRPVTIENLSDRSVFIQIGTLLAGGLQDQVVAQDTILPPRSGRLPLEIFCVDPFRGTARGDEDPDQFSSTGALFPSRIARLVMLAGSANTKPVQLIQQSGLWWNIDTVRAQLSRRVGEPLEPPRTVAWKPDDGRDIRPDVLLRARRSSWRTSLPLALENRRLAELQQAYLEAFSAPPAGDDVIGAVFAINGRIEGAEIYQSHELFGQMWPNLLRAYATQAMAASDATADELPPVSAVKASLAAAQESEARQRTRGSAFVVRETDASILTEARERNGGWVHRSYLPKLGLTGDLDTPDAMLTSILQRGEINGRAIASLSDRQVVVLQHAAPDQWTAAVAPSLEIARDLDPVQWPDWERMTTEASHARLFRDYSEWRPRDRDTPDLLSAFAFAAIAAWLLFGFARRCAVAAGRGMRRGGRALAAATRVAMAQAATLLAALIAALAIAVVGTAAVMLRLSLRAAAVFARSRQGLSLRPSPLAARR